MKTWRCFFYMLLLVLNPAQAGIQINATRVIYPAAKKEVTLSITNESTTPRLLQAWIDNGDTDIHKATENIPFIVTPPISRLNPAKGQTLRIIFTGGNIPKDRESVFWLNVLEVQPKPAGKKEGKESFMQFPVRSRLKIFYRPVNLTGSPIQAVKELRWRLVRNRDNYILQCDNPSPFNISFKDVRLAGATSDEKANRSGLCPAKGKKDFHVPGGSGRTVVYSIIDDYGSNHAGSAEYLYQE